MNWARTCPPMAANDIEIKVLMVCLLVFPLCLPGKAQPANGSLPRMYHQTISLRARAMSSSASHISRYELLARGLAGGFMVVAPEQYWGGGLNLHRTTPDPIGGSRLLKGRSPPTI